MAVAFVNDTDKTPATGSSFTYTSFVVSGTNPLILVKIALDSATATVSSVVCSAGLTAGTPVEVKALRDTQDALRTYVSIWAIPAPTGTGTITVTLSASVPWQSNAELWQGADQTTPCSAADAATANAATNPLSVTPANLTANDAASGFAANAGNGDAPSFNQTQTFIDNTTNVNASGGYHLGTGAVTCTWGTPTTDDVIVAVRIAAAAAAAGSALEWKQPTSQPTNHYVPAIVMCCVNQPRPVPFLPTLAPTITGVLDWIAPSVDIVWT